MRSSGFILALTIVGSMPISILNLEISFAQSESSAKPQTGVAIKKKLTYPVYPPVARQAGAQGEVNISLGIRPNGTVESAVVESGHPLFQQAALESAQHSQYECRQCAEPLTPFSLSYIFEIQDEPCGQNTNFQPSTTSEGTRLISLETQRSNQVLTVSHRFCIIDYWPDRQKARSAKCLYLWKRRWKSLP